MSLKLIAPAAIAAFTFAGASAQAESWNEKIEMCAEAAEAEGLIDLSDYQPEFDGGTTRRMSLTFYPIAQGDAGDSVEIECRISRGRVVSVDPLS